MTIAVAEDAGRQIATLSGEIDLSNSPAVRKALLGALGRKQPLVVRMDQVSYIDSSGIASLVEALQQAKKAGLAFALVGVGGAPLRALQLARLDKVFPMAETMEQAPKA